MIAKDKKERGLNDMNNQNKTVMELAQTALLAALCYVSFTFLQIKIPVPGGDATSLHIGNAFCVLGALLLGGVYGGIAGAVGMTIADIMANTIIMEQVFTIPGMGSLLITSISNRDYPVVQGIIVLIAAMVVLVNFAVDVLYAKIDPRIRIQA